MKTVRFFLIFCMLFLICTPNSFSLEREEERYHIAVKAFSDGFYDAALSLFKRFIEDFPESKKIYKVKLYIARCYYQQENYHQALDVLAEMERKSLRHNFIDQVYYWLGVINFKGKNFQEALDYANRVVGEYPDSPVFWMARSPVKVSSSSCSLGDSKTRFQPSRSRARSVGTICGYST